MPIASMIDMDEEPTDDPDEAVSCVVGPIPTRSRKPLWIALDLDGYEEEILQ